MQGGTPCKHVDEHHAVCISCDSGSGAEAFRGSEAGAEKTLDLLADLDPHGLCQSSSQADENGV